MATCDERLQRVFHEVIKHFDCKIIEGHRGEALQHLYFTQGKSKLDWPHGKHNRLPSQAVDVMPCPINWFDKERNCYFFGFVMGIATSMGIPIIWGHDWNRNNDLNDQSFIDTPHVELVIEAPERSIPV